MVWSLVGVPNAAITLAVIVRDGEVEVIVSDTGPGPSDRTTLFDPFATTRTHAAGLGLTTSRLIARQWGGELEALEGARFRLVLPAIAPTL
jgi:two-component system C4-dicarboxylate transport sensor histidine kinase DctB